MRSLDARRFNVLARRVARAEAALTRQAEAARAACLLAVTPAKIRFDAARLFAEPAEIALRLIAGAVQAFAGEGEPELAKLERLEDRLRAAFAAGRSESRTLAGALVRLDRGILTVMKAPERMRKAALLAPNSTR